MISFVGVLLNFYCLPSLFYFADYPVRFCTPANGLVWCGLFDVAWFGEAWFSLVWFGLVWFCLVWLGMVWFGIPGVLLKFHFLPALCLALQIPRGGLAAQGNGSQQTSLTFPLLVV